MITKVDVEFSPSRFCCLKMHMLLATQNLLRKISTQKEYRSLAITIDFVWCCDRRLRGSVAGASPTIWPGPRPKAGAQWSSLCSVVAEKAMIYS